MHLLKSLGRPSAFRLRPAAVKTDGLKRLRRAAKRAASSGRTGFTRLTGGAGGGGRGTIAAAKTLRSGRMTLRSACRARLGCACAAVAETARSAQGASKVCS